MIRKENDKTISMKQQFRRRKVIVLKYEKEIAKKNDISAYEKIIFVHESCIWKIFL